MRETVVVRVTVRKMVYGRWLVCVVVVCGEWCVVWDVVELV